VSAGPLSGRLARPRRLLAGGLLVAFAVAASACGTGTGGTPVQRALRDTAKHLDDIRSATMQLRLSAASPAAKGPVGFELSGPFALPSGNGLPVADLKVRELRGGKSYDSRFVSTGEKAYVVRAGKVTPLEGNGGIDVGGDGGGLSALRIDRWLLDPVMTDGGDVGGVRTDRIVARLDVAAAFDDLAKIGDRLGESFLAGLKPLDDRSRQQLETAAKDSSVEVLSGHDDRLMRRLIVKVTLTAAGQVPAALRSLVPVTLSLALDLTDVNRPVHVEAPQPSG
jgi:hypothetical protein